MSWLSEALQSIVPTDESSPAAVRAHRIRVALIACCAFLLVSSIVLPALFLGLPMLGRVAWADEVDGQIAQAVGPIQKDIADLKREIQAQTAATNAAVAEYIYQEVLQLSRLRCATADARERDRLYVLIRARQLRYRQLSGDGAYTAPTCADL